MAFTPVFFPKKFFILHFMLGSSMDDLCYDICAVNIISRKEKISRMLSIKLFYFSLFSRIAKNKIKCCNRQRRRKLFMYFLQFFPVLSLSIFRSLETFAPSRKKFYFLRRNYFFISSFYTLFPRREREKCNAEKLATSHASHKTS
jgi:hypothetical protein